MTPCHEQGVWLDGFHEERTEEEDFAEGSAEDIRERRACPSGEREETCSIFIMINQKKNRENNRDGVTLEGTIFPI